ncbi:hypothetical protein JW877_00955 [bacterium]|nr:hypothetical protein [bacterium]
MKIIGYMEGTDPAFLTEMVVKGHGTMPLGNGADSHGKFVKLLTNRDGVSLFVTYLHKITGIPTYDVDYKDLLYPCKSMGIPAIIVAPRSCHEKARELLKDIQGKLYLVDPQDLLKEACSIIETCEDFA